MSDTKPTVVGVHGAFAESASFNGLAARLLEDGYAFVAVSNPLRGKDQDADAVRSVLDGVERPVILIGHSMGGFAISNAATGYSNVLALIFVAGFAPDAGETPAELSSKFPGGTLGDTLAPFPLVGGGNDLYIAQDKYHHQFAADLPASEAALMAATQRPIAETDLNEPADEPAWKTIPSWFLYGDADLNIPTAAHRFMAERAGSKRTVEIAGASHVVGMSHTNALVDLIAEAANATQGSMV